MLVLHFDVTSPSSAVAVLRLEPIAAEGHAVRFAGFDALGLEVAVPPTLDLLADLERARPAAAALGLRLRRPTRQPPTLSCHLVGELAEARGRGPQWRRACFRACLEQDRDVSDPSVLAELAGAAGLEPQRALDHARDPAARRRLRAEMAARRRAGLGGVPVLEVDGTFVSAELAEPDLRQLASL